MIDVCSFDVFFVSFLVDYIGFKMINLVEHFVFLKKLVMNDAKLDEILEKFCLNFIEVVKIRSFP